MNWNKYAEYRDALEWRKRLPDIVGEIDDLEWVVNHAKTKYAEGLDAWSMLESKADSLIRYLGGGAGLLTVGSILSVSIETVTVFLCMIPAIVCAVFGIIFAILSRAPADFSATPQANKACGCAQKYRDKSSAIFMIGEYHLAAVKVRVSSAKKAKLVTEATWCYFGAIVLLLVPFGVALYFVS